MCGFYFSTIDFEERIVQQKMSRIDFRGPDASCILRPEEGVIMAHNRLAVIDLDTRSNQPFRYGHIWIVYNGEIYNYKDLKQALKEKGYVFKTTSDTEVICAAYQHYGLTCLQHFNGMFSFVIYDTSNQKVFAARDRFGKKPFFYRLEKNALECASQPSQIAIGTKLTINEEVIRYLLVYRYIPAPCTIYKEVFKLPAGCFFYYTVGDKDVLVKKYWDIDYDKALSYKGSYEEAMEELEKVLSDAINIRLVSDVPVGAFLSGGIDSSLVAALLSQLQKGKGVRTFSVKFNEDKYDESRYATAIAKHLGIQHTNIECDFKEGIRLIEQLPRYYDEPFADASAIPSMLLSKAARQHVTVALSGDGGDEGFLGYNYFDWINQNAKIYQVPYFLRYTIGASLGLFSYPRLKQTGALLKQRHSDALINKVFESQPGIFKTAFKSYRNDDLNKIASLQYDLLQKAADVNIKLWLENDSNVKVDRAAMSSSLEVRSPFLDYRVIEFARTLPVAFRYKDGVKKRILKDQLYRYIPRELLDRPKKGFTMPFEDWFRTDLKGYVYDKLSSAGLHTIPDLDVKYIMHNVDLHMKHKKNFYPVIWSLIVLINWLEYNKISL